jgi:hypothetical protein
MKSRPPHILIFNPDPMERRNVAGDPACAAPLAAMKDRLPRGYRRTSDVVPHGTDKR